MNTDLLAIAQPLCWAMEARNFVAMLHAAAPIGTSSQFQVERRDGTTTIPMRGIIWRGAPKLAQIFLQIVDPDAVADAITAAQADGAVKAIVLSIDSPGGTTSGVPELATTVAACTKPITADVRGMACSAAYWACAGANTITARPSCQVGSIGVYSTFQDSSKLLEAAGVSIDVFRSAELKATGIPGTRLSAAQRDYLQGQVNELFAMFTGHVSQHRAVDESVFNGAAFLAAKACQLGLVDHLAGEPATRQQPGGRAGSRAAGASPELDVESCGAGLSRVRVRQKDDSLAREIDGLRLVMEGKAKICRVGVVSSWCASDFEKGH